MTKKKTFEVSINNLPAALKRLDLPAEQVKVIEDYKKQFPFLIEDEENVLVSLDQLWEALDTPYYTRPGTASENPDGLNQRYPKVRVALNNKMGGMLALARNTVFEETTEIGFNSRTKKVKIPKKLKPLAIIKLYEESALLTPEEQSIIDSMQGVKWKPRQRYTGFKFNREPLKFEYLFDNINEYEGWLEFNRLENEQYQGYDVDIMDAAYNGISD